MSGVSKTLGALRVRPRPMEGILKWRTVGPHGLVDWTNVWATVDADAARPRLTLICGPPPEEGETDDSSQAMFLKDASLELFDESPDGHGNSFRLEQDGELFGVFEAASLEDTLNWATTLMRAGAVATKNGQGVSLDDLEVKASSPRASESTPTDSDTPLGEGRRRRRAGGSHRSRPSSHKESETPDGRTRRASASHRSPHARPDAISPATEGRPRRNSGGRSSSTRHRSTDDAHKYLHFVDEAHKGGADASRSRSSASARSHPDEGEARSRRRSSASPRRPSSGRSEGGDNTEGRSRPSSGTRSSAGSRPSSGSRTSSGTRASSGSRRSRSPSKREHDASSRHPQSGEHGSRSGSHRRSRHRRVRPSTYGETGVKDSPGDDNLLSPKTLIEQSSSESSGSAPPSLPTSDESSSEASSIESLEDESPVGLHDPDLAAL
jgi:hypothetical protein